MNITVQDCDRDVCAPIQAILAVALTRFGVMSNAGPDANVAVPIEMYNNNNVPQVIIAGKAPKSNTWNWCMVPQEGLLTMRSRYGTTDDHELAVEEATSTVAVAAAATTALPSLTLNADFIGTGFVAATKMRPFAVLAKITIPNDVYRIILTASAPVSPVPETITVDFTDTECRELTVLIIQASRLRFVTSFGTPTVPSALAYNLPYGLSDLESPGAGAIETLMAATYDADFVQVASSLLITTWQIPYGGRFMRAVCNNQGIIGPGLRSIYTATPQSFAIEAAQPIF